MEIEPIIASLRAVVIQLEGKLPGEDTQNAWELLDAGEPGVALENLCTQLYEYDVLLPLPVFSEVVAAGQAMNLALDTWADLIVES